MYPRKPRGIKHFRTSELSQTDSCRANNYPCKSLKASSNFTQWHYALFDIQINIEYVVVVTHNMF